MRIASLLISMHQVFFDPLLRFSCYGNVMAGSRQAELAETAEVHDEPPDEGETNTLVGARWGAPTKGATALASDRTDDPVRMYLREMGSVELLSREGEIAIAKRIEAGRGAMIAGLCESPLTFQAIIIWRDELNEGKVFLRDIIDLDATYAGPDAKAMPAPAIGHDGQPIVAVPGAPPAAPTGATPLQGTPPRPNRQGGAGRQAAPGVGHIRGHHFANCRSLHGYQS